MKKLGLAAMFLLCVGCAFSQSDEGPKQSKFFAGGSFGLAFGRYTFISLNPQVGYRFNRYLAAGVGANFLYVRIKEKYLNGNDYSRTNLGVTGLNTFLRIYPIQRFLLQVQPEANYRFGSTKYFDTSPPITIKENAEIVPSVLVGGGLVTPTEKGAMLFTVMYDALQNPNSPYGNRPIVNVGFNVNF